MLTGNVLYYGSPLSLPVPHSLRAGPLTLSYENGDLRSVRLGRHQVVQRIYAAVRDRDWGTVPNEISNERIEAGSDSFRITYHVKNRQDDIHFEWDALITGLEDGTVSFSFEGEAITSFQHSRIGFCILHPVLECAGLTCRIDRVDGPPRSGVFPRFIAPGQPVEPFNEMAGMTYAVLPGVEVELRFTGDIFEMEDQRNWTDASYKTFCTPLRLGYPHCITAGTKVAQSVTLRLTGDWKAGLEAAPQAGADLIVNLDLESAKPIPGIGLGAASHGEALTAREIARLRDLNLSHLRLDLAPSQPGWRSGLQRVSGEAREISVPLEIALLLSSDAEAELDQLTAQVGVVKPDVCRWLVFHTAELVPSEKLVRQARERLALCTPGVPVGSGSDAGFYEFNTERRVTDALDFVAYPLNPQTHAFDNASLVQTLPVQAVTAESTRQFAGLRPIVISPITLKMRFNPYAVGPEIVQPGTLPPQVDARQMSLFGAGWTLGSIKHLAECGQVSSLTYHETTGWRGVMDTESGSPLPDQFPALPGMVFPLYHVLGAVGEFAGGEVLSAVSSAPDTVEALALRKDDRLRLVLANFTPRPQRVNVAGLPGAAWCKNLDETTVEAALHTPEVFRAGPGDIIYGGSLILLPFGVAILDTVCQRH
jgi:hypothetical protein